MSLVSFKGKVKLRVKLRYKALSEMDAQHRYKALSEVDAQHRSSTVSQAHNIPCTGKWAKSTAFKVAVPAAGRERDARSNLKADSGHQGYTSVL